MNEHNCTTLPKSEISIYLGENETCWALNISKEAKAQDLQQSSYLENVGDIMWQTQLHILHCPFCGEKLPKFGSVDQTNYGYFRHNNFSRWK
jgi:hypothetical protein